MDRKVNIIRLICCGIVFFGSSIDGLVGSNEVKLEDYQLGFLMKPDIPVEVEEFSKAVGEKLQFAGKIDESKKMKWFKGSEGMGKELRSQIRKVFCGNEGNNENYRWLMNEAEKIVQKEHGNIIHSIPFETIKKAYKAKMEERENKKKKIRKGRDEERDKKRKKEEEKEERRKRRGKRREEKDTLRKQIYPEIKMVFGMPAEILQHFTQEDFTAYNSSDTIFQKNKQSSKFHYPIVQVASQFNALESTKAKEIDALFKWVKDNTQGPGASLTAFYASALRFEGQKYGKLPDAMEPLLKGCQVNKKSILKQYPKLYLNGYLRLNEITEPSHLEYLADYIEKNIGKLRIQMQWVRCEESGEIQLQVFCAAPSFQGLKIKEWKESKEIIYERICRALLVAEYDALAMIGRLMHRPLHLTRVGMGVFNNPPGAFMEAIKVALSTLYGSKIPVYLHGFSQVDIEGWDGVLVKNGFQQVNFNELQSSLIQKAQRKK